MNTRQTRNKTYSSPQIPLLKSAEPKGETPEKVSSEESVTKPDEIVPKIIEPVVLSINLNKPLYDQVSSLVVVPKPPQT